MGVCRRCGDEGHDGRRHRGHTVTKAGGEPMPVRTRDDECLVCAPEGHSVRRHGARMRRAAIFGDVPSGPRPVERGDRFIVVEDVPEDRLVGDVVWVALFATGRKVGGYEEWRMDRARKSGPLKSRAFFPQLYPFFKTGAAPSAPNVTIEHHEATPAPKKIVAR